MACVSGGICMSRKGLLRKSLDQRGGTPCSGIRPPLFQRVRPFVEGCRQAVARSFIIGVHHQEPRAARCATWGYKPGDTAGGRRSATRRTGRFCRVDLSKASAVFPIRPSAILPAHAAKSPRRRWVHLSQHALMPNMVTRGHPDMGPAALSVVVSRAPQRANRTQNNSVARYFCAVGHADIQRGRL